MSGHPLPPSSHHQHQPSQQHPHISHQQHQTAHQPQQHQIVPPNQQQQQQLAYHAPPGGVISEQRVSGGAEQVPPRYQPPPQPNQQHSGGGVGGGKQQLQLQQRQLKELQEQGKQRGVQGIPLKPNLHPQAYNNRSLRTSVAPSSGRASSEDSEHRGVPNQQLQYQHQQQNDMLKFVARRSHDGQEPVVMQVQGPPIQRISNNSAGNNDHIRQQLQALANEVRTLKEANRRLSDDNQELRDLCCFLDDDRQKGRKLAREWQRFGRYTASVMRQEVAAYQSKLRQLDDKQQELIRDNLELKELCLYLDEERTANGVSGCSRCRSSQSAQSAMGSASTGAVVLRDDGDGSSSSTNADEPPPPPPPLPPPHHSVVTSSAGNPGGGSREHHARLMGGQQEGGPPGIVRQTRSAFSDQTMRYVRSLESRVRQLEAERRGSSAVTTGPINPLGPSQQQQSGQQLSCPEPALAGRPEAVVRALQVLEVREGLESSTEQQLNAVNMLAHHTMQQPGYNLELAHTNDHMDDGEKALVREMCNVVWRKLEEDGPPA